MEDKKRVYCISNLVDGLTKYKVYEVEYIHHGQTVYYDIINDNGVKSTHNANDFVDTKQVVIKGYKSYGDFLLGFKWTIELLKRKGIKIDVHDDFLLEKYNYKIKNSLSREDKDLIKIAKEINDESIIKVVDIPIDVKYDIQSEECGFAEIIIEKHREWC